MSKTLPPINLSFRIRLSFENRVNDYVIAPLWIQCTPCASSWRGPKRTNITSCERSDSPSPGLDKSLLLQALVHKGLLKKTTLLFRPVFSRAFQKAMARNIFRSWGGTVSKTKFKPLILELQQCDRGNRHVVSEIAITWEHSGKVWSGLDQ